MRELTVCAFDESGDRIALLLEVPAISGGIARSFDGRLIATAGDEIGAIGRSSRFAAPIDEVFQFGTVVDPVDGGSISWFNSGTRHGGGYGSGFTAIEKDGTHAKGVVPGYAHMIANCDGSRMAIASTVEDLMTDRTLNHQAYRIERSGAVRLLASWVTEMSKSATNVMHCIDGGLLATIYKDIATGQASLVQVDRTSGRLIAQTPLESNAVRPGDIGLFGSESA